jgi:sugar fermentation stimulation protein
MFISSTFLKRRQRFFMDALLADGTPAIAHCANTGSLKGVLKEGATLWLSPAADPARKLKYTAELMDIGTTLVGINTAVANRVAGAAIKTGVIEELTGYTAHTAEVKYGANSRIDWLLTAAGRPDCYVEVKSVTYAVGTTALFPDAPTERGLKHLHELVAMVKHFMEVAGEVESGFFLHNFQALCAALSIAKMSGKRVILFGVTYALLDAAGQAKEKLGENVVIIETGGMKGRHKEMVRHEVHTRLKELWGATVIRSEYGMTELLSQGYTHEGEIFKAGYTLQVLRRLPDDPKTVTTNAGKGVFNLIDLANVHSCSFIATDDQGTLFADGSFIVEGRIDHADVRGCNLLSLT